MNHLIDVKLEVDERYEEEFDLDYQVGSVAGPVHVVESPIGNPEDLAVEEKNPQEEAVKKKDVDRLMLLEEVDKQV